MGSLASAGTYTAWYDASEKLGCGGKDAGARTVKCMRTKSMREILSVVNADFKPSAYSQETSSQPFRS
jgi:hypothetical protein